MIACTEGLYAFVCNDSLKFIVSFHSALADDPNYVKALQRRATCNEKIGSWTSLASAQDGESFIKSAT